MTSPAKEIPYHGQGDDRSGDDRCVVHCLFRDREDGWQRKDDRDEYDPADAVEIDGPSKQTVAKVEWPGFEVNFWMMLEDAPKNDGDYVRYVERHGA